MRMDLIDCFLMNPFLIGEQEYMRIHSQYVDQQFRHLYNLHGKIDKDGYVYCKIQLGMYGLKQAAILAYKLIKEILQPAGYYPIKESNRWQHKTRKKILHYVWMILGLSISIKTTRYISSMCYKNIMKFPSIGQVRTTAA